MSDTRPTLLPRVIEHLGDVDVHESHAACEPSSWRYLYAPLWKMQLGRRYANPYTGLVTYEFPDETIHGSSPLHRAYPRSGWVYLLSSRPSEAKKKKKGRDLRPLSLYLSCALRSEPARGTSPAVELHELGDQCDLVCGERRANVSFALPPACSYRVLSHRDLPVRLRWLGGARCYRTSSRRSLITSSAQPLCRCSGATVKPPHL